MSRALTQRLLRWEVLLGVSTVVLFAWAVWRTPSFLTEFNLSQAMAGISERALIVLPMALLIVIREIDISVASILALTSVALGISIRAGHPLALSIVIALVVGVACGLFNGVLVIKLGLPALVVTLGTIALFRGLGYVALGNASVNILPPRLNDFGLDTVPHTPVPWTLLPFLVLAPVFFVVVHASAIGRRIFAIGGEPSVARYSGIDINRYRVAIFAVTGLMCAVAGIVFTARTANARANNALGLELDIITIVFLGGVSMTGGKGRLSGVVWALVLVGLLRNVMTLNLVSGDDQATVIGLILIGSLLVTNAGDRLVEWVRHRRLARTLAANRRTDPPSTHTTTTTATQPRENPA